ncbi:Crp/Fnr family transcriptional regulator [Amycolatopsis sp. NEAU-NG30]|uniref:Crp/Fnr family transcriptional regulator n=1 Tax=Amycolatopsis melonis TaxID=3156488 RepID=A0ABV0LTW8_9PSEU
MIYDARQHVLRQGEESHHVLVLLDGLVKVVVHTEFGRPVLLDLRSRGDLLGEMSMLEHRRRSADVVTCTTARAKLIMNTQLQMFFDRHPDAWAAMAGSLSSRLHRADVHRAEFVACPAPARVGRVLAEIARAHGVRTPDGWDLDVALTQAEIASLAGVALATFEKALRLLHRSGLVRRKSRRIVVGDLDRLIRFGISDGENPYQYGIGDADVAQS